MTTLEWGEEAPSLHDSSILRLLQIPGCIELWVELYEEEQWDQIALVFQLMDSPDDAWHHLERLLEAGAEMEIMKLVVTGEELHLGISVDPEMDGLRWLDVRDCVRAVGFRPSPFGLS